MNSGYYAACAGLESQNQALELVANNLANLSTTAYRGQHPTFRSLLAGSPSIGGNLLNYAINNYNVLGDTHLDPSPGNLQETGSPLDLAIEGGGFLVVKTQAGLRYTRNGSLQVSPKGQLITRAGDPVLGQQGPILLPNGVPTISADGTISVDGALVEKLRLVEFADDSPPVSEGASYYSASGAPPHPATASDIRQGMLEASNVSAVAATVDLITVQRRFEMLQGALSAYYNTFNRIAAEDLPRVS